MQRVDQFPSHELNGIKYRAGKTMPFGATVLDDSTVNFSVYSKHSTRCNLVLYHAGDAKPFIEIPIPDEFRIGSVYSVMVFGLDWENIEYGYRFDGPYDLQQGHCFDKTKIVLDPYAKLVSGREEWHTRTYPKSHSSSVAA